MSRFEYYHVREKALWLEQNYDDVHNEIIDNSPKMSFVFALDWNKYRERPHKATRRLPLGDIKTEFYNKFWIRLYFGYHQFHLTIRLNKLKYTNYEEWRAFEKARMV